MSNTLLIALVVLVVVLILLVAANFRLHFMEHSAAALEREAASLERIAAEMARGWAAKARMNNGLTLDIILNTMREKEGLPSRVLTYDR